MSGYAEYEVYERPETNTLGIAGFVCSLLGLVLSAGILSPIGLILSLVALGRQPRGFAIAGVVIGLIGTCGGLLIVLAIVAVGLGAVLAAVGISAAMVALEQPEKLEISSDMARIAAAAEIYEEDHGYVPADLSELSLRPSTLIDPWGSRYRYHLSEDEPGYDVVSAGEDTQFGTEDDVAFSRFDEVWEDAGPMRFNVQESDNGAAAVWSFGDLTIEVRGEDEKGTVLIRKDGRTYRIEGDEHGGRMGFDPENDPAPDSEAPADDEPAGTAPPDDDEQDDA